MRVFDGFTFFNELDLLEIRLEELDPVVDVFVLVEAATTFRGAPKPFHFVDNADRFSRWASKIRHVALHDLGDLDRATGLHPTKRPASDAWAREWLQRDAILQGLTDASPDDLIMVSDVDEIPRRETVAQLRAEPNQTRRVSYLKQRTYVNFLDWRRDGVDWIGTRAITRRWLRSPQALRLSHHQGHARTWAPVRRLERRIRMWRDFGAPLSPTPVPDAGWHFTSLGGAAAVSLKMRSYSEEVGPAEAWTEDRVRARFARGETHDGGPIAVAPAEDLPHAVREGPTRYSHLTSASLAQMEHQNGC